MEIFFIEKKTWLPALKQAPCTQTAPTWKKNIRIYDSRRWCAEETGPEQGKRVNVQNAS